MGKTVHHIKDSVDLVGKLKGKVIPPNYSICSFDLVNMYTNIPQGPTLELVKEKLRADKDLAKRTPIRIDDIIAMIKLDLDLAYFRWNANYYKQLKGFGMGKSTSSPLSDLYMESFEQAALTNYPTGDSTTSPSDVILFWLRKADDTLVAVHNDHIQALHDYLNSIHPDIKWTKEVEKVGRIPMLDVTVICNSDGTLDFDVYRKPTHTNTSHSTATNHSPTNSPQFIHSHVVPASFPLRKNSRKTNRIELRRPSPSMDIPNGHTTEPAIGLLLLLLFQRLLLTIPPTIPSSLLLLSLPALLLLLPPNSASAMSPSHFSRALRNPSLAF